MKTKTPGIRAGVFLFGVVMDKLSDFDLQMLQTALLNYSLRHDISPATFRAIEDLTKRLSAEIDERDKRAKVATWS